MIELINLSNMTLQVYCIFDSAFRIIRTNIFICFFTCIMQTHLACVQVYILVHLIHINMHLSICLYTYFPFVFVLSHFSLNFLIFFGVQAHFSQLDLPISDYITDLKSVLDQSIRIMQAMIDICANSGWLTSSMACMHLLQMVMQVLLFILHI